MTLGRPFGPITNQPKSLKFGTFDIETWGFNARQEDFALGVAFDGINSYRFTSPIEMGNFLVSRRFRGFTWFAHNLSGYDGLCLFGDPSVFFGSQNVLMKGGKWIVAKYRDGNAKSCVKIADSLNIIQASVASIGEQLGYGKGFTPEKFKTGNRKVGIADSDWEYCLRDCQIVYRALSEIQSELGELRVTAPSLALQYFTRKYLRDTYWVKHDADLQFRYAYFGGRVQVYRIGKLNANHYQDINSLYSYAMVSTCFPDPSTLRILPNPSVESLEYALLTFEGMVECTVSHLPNRIGYLPVKRKDGKVVFPVNSTFTGKWTFVELRYAISTGKVTVTNVNQIIIGNRIKSPFIEFVNDIYSRKCNSIGFRREIFKLLLNAFYGKFAEYHHQQEWYSDCFSPIVLEELEARYGEIEWNPMPFGNAGYYKSTDKSNYDRFTSHTIFAWASYITSRARVINAEWQDKITAKGIKIYYTDTDSFDTDKKLPDEWLSPTELGLMKHCPKDEILEVFGNKDYSKTIDGIRRTKGISRSPAAQLEMIGMDPFTRKENLFAYNRIVRTREARRRGLRAGSRIRVVKRLRNVYDKRQVNADGSTSEIEIKE